MTQLKKDAEGNEEVRDPDNEEATAGEPVVMMSFRAPTTIYSHLQKQKDRDGITNYVIESVELKRDLDAALEELRGDLVRVAANELGIEYRSGQAKTLALVIRRGIELSKQTKK